MTDQTTVWASLALSQTVAYCIPWINPNTFQPNVDTNFFFTPSTVTGTVGLLTVPSIISNVPNTPTLPLIRNASKLGGAGFGWGSFNLDYYLSIIAGAVTINKPAGQVLVALGAASIVVTNNLITANSIVLCQIASADATFTFIKSVVCTAGSFTITGNANATANCKVNFFVINTDS